MTGTLLRRTIVANKPRLAITCRDPAPSVSLKSGRREPERGNSRAFVSIAVGKAAAAFSSTFQCHRIGETTSLETTTNIPSDLGSLPENRRGEH